MILTAKQEQGVKLVTDLYRQNKKIITISGYAGTGKSTIVRHIVEQLHLEENVAYVTFTGKASLVLRNKGLPATTIHKLIYNCFVDRFGKLIVTKKQQLPDHIHLIIIDEISMVSKKLLEDLMSFNIPIIALGDHGQLEPIGEDNGLLKAPDFVLTDIIRQAEDNPIIRLSKLVREGRFERMDNSNVKVLSPKDFDYSMVQWADQTLCGFNTTRNTINQNVRKIFYKTDEQLPVVGEKLISLKNKWDICDSEDNPLINGTICNIARIDKNIYNGTIFIATLVDSVNGSVFSELQIDTNTFKNRPIPLKNNLPVFDYGYCITVHKSQGSEWDKILLFDECLNRETYNRWLYTGITRAKDKIVIIKH